MKFKNKGNQRSDEMECEVSELYNFADSMQIPYEVIETVNNKTKVVFDDVHAPYVESTIGKLRNLVNDLLGKYLNSQDKEASVLVYALQYLLRIEENSVMDFYAGEIDAVFSDDFHNEEIQKDVKKLRDVLLNTHHGYNVSGAYNHAAKTIILFTKNIKDTFEDYLVAFCHEFFHAIDHTFLDFKGSKEKRNKYYHHVVLASLSTYFTIDYLKAHGYSDQVKELKEDVNRHSPVFYPFAGCKRLLTSGYYDDILARAAYDFEDALRTLVDRYEADIILQMEMYTVRGLPSSKKTVPASVKPKQAHNHDQYEFNGVVYCKNRLVLEVVKEYIRLHNPSLYELAKAFPDELQGGQYGVFQLTDDILRGHLEWLENPKRFFLNEPLTVEGKEILVCNQWSIDDIGDFINKAKKLGIQITVIPAED